MYRSWQLLLLLLLLLPLLPLPLLPLPLLPLPLLPLPPRSSLFALLAGCRETIYVCAISVEGGSRLDHLTSPATLAGHFHLDNRVLAALLIHPLAFFAYWSQPVARSSAMIKACGCQGVAAVAALLLLRRLALCVPFCAALLCPACVTEAVPAAQALGMQREPSALKGAVALGADMWLVCRRVLCLGQPVQSACLTECLLAPWA